MKYSLLYALALLSAGCVFQSRSLAQEELPPGSKLNFVFPIPAAGFVRDTEGKVDYTLKFLVNDINKAGKRKGFKFKLEGDSQALWTPSEGNKIGVDVLENDQIENIALQLEELLAPDILVAREADTFYVYAKNAPEPATPISYLYRCRNNRATDLAAILDKKNPINSFPQATELKGDGKANLKHHVAKATTGATGVQSLISDEVKYHVLAPQNALVLSGKLADIRKAVRNLKTIDQVIDIVLIEVLIVQYFHDDQFTWRYNLKDGSVLKADPPKFSTGTIPPDTITPSDKFGPKPWGIDVQNLAFNPATGAASLAYSGIGSLTSQFKQNLTLLVSEDLARVVTNPHIAVTNGQAGQILLNEKFNFVNSVVTSNGTVSQKADVLNSITSLNVTPTIVGPNRVHLSVNTTLSTFGGVTNLSSTLPGQRINELGTSVFIKPHTSLILGGLVKEEVVEVRDRIPGASKIPVIGHLFRGRDDVRRYSETVIYVTPYIKERPAGYANNYWKDVFDHSQRMNDRREEIRYQHRIDKANSDWLYRKKELDDREEHQNLHHNRPRDPHPHHVDWHHGYPIGIGFESEAQDGSGFGSPDGSGSGELSRPLSETQTLDEDQWLGQRIHSRQDGHPTLRRAPSRVDLQPINGLATSRGKPEVRRLPPTRAKLRRGSENLVLPVGYSERVPNPAGGNAMPPQTKE